MAKLKIDATKLNIFTTNGLFSTSANFTDGLNILRAKNSTGKSSFMNAILYALGIEELLGGTNGKTMKPVLREEVAFEGNKYKVIESNVQLQISNSKGKTITVTRWITTSTRDEKLVEVQFGPTLTENGLYESKDYYVHMPGSASNEAGFHLFLADFIDWELPLVPAFEGKDRILYIQSLFPLFFVEQIKGWSSFYAPPSTNYGIRDISTRAIEFLLGLDVLQNSKLKEEMKIKKLLITQEWASLVNSIKEKANSVGATIQNLSEKPEILSTFHVLVYNDDQNLVSISSRILMLKEHLYGKANIIKSIQEVEREHEIRINEVEERVLFLQNESNVIRREIHSEQINKEALEYNIIQLKHDLKTNQDAQRLYNLGSSQNSLIARKVCPTCNQSIHDTLLPQDIDLQPMSLEENISYIKEQLAALEFGISQSRSVIESKNKKLLVINGHLEEERRKLRTLKHELREDPRMLSNVDVEETLNLKWKIRQLEEVEVSIENLSAKLDELKNDWQQYCTKLNKIPEEFFSELDKSKLITLEKQFIYYLSEFGYSSTSLTDISISRDKYTPVVKGFDIKFDSSASDYVRLIWAFTLALEYVTHQHGGNHPNLILMDEPGQQQMNYASIGKLFESLSKLGGQSIIASSLSTEEINTLTKNINKRVIDLGNDYIIKPVGSKE
ncbi:AAA family ATPase [Brevibacillus brevis]|uniref:AAA family ATPase n=1 Tax=Brevibacillus brevis TaxID=1393 RepID=UPI000D0E5741|nr:AAA family ATPase [Brevibacillus brevis]PSJ64992.1 hypothetical protein C7J99_30360 [Brevibacillus brevis]RED29296.1 hypothetical protein DES34_10683 [Brevibacillus brevis]GEC91474.1 hypothetical protein BBR01nite_38050 [Brevibacillus brevis]VEF87897.1 Uncharacterised protein [Brevibacillus brevis]